MKKLWLAIFISLSLRLLLTAYHGIVLNPDEQVNWEIAQNHRAGNGYTQEDVQTSFHNSFTVFLYEGLQDAGISKLSWEWFCTSLELSLFAVSVFYFRKLLKFYVPEYVFTGTLLYLFYPSNFYIGVLPFYENITLPLMVIWLAIIIKTKLKAMDIFLLVLIPILSVWLRATSVVIYLCLFTAIFILIRKYRLLMIAMMVYVPLLQFPAFLKNHAQFGHYILSTEAGFNLMQGHNELARGSWRGGWQGGHQKDTSAYCIYSYRVIPGLDTMNEYQESEARQKYALNWMTQNPLKEILLTVRKIIIYFSPKNFEEIPSSAWYNPLNTFVHLGFVVFCLFFLKRSNLLLLVIPLATLIISIVFLVEYRVRFYAEPFMIICTLIVAGNIFIRNTRLRQNV